MNREEKIAEKVVTSITRNPLLGQKINVDATIIESKPSRLQRRRSQRFAIHLVLEDGEGNQYPYVYNGRLSLEELSVGTKVKLSGVIDSVDSRNNIRRLKKGTVKMRVVG